VSNVLSEEKKQQVIALGRLGWSLRRIQRETGVRRETISAYLKEAGIELRPPRGRQLPAKPASRAEGVTTDPEQPKPASAIALVTPDSSEESLVRNTAPATPQPSRSPSASACEAHRDAIEVALSRGRNAKAIWQDLVDACGFIGGYQSVKRFVRKLQGKVSVEARAVIQTAPGLHYGESRVMVRTAQRQLRVLSAGQHFAVPNFP
jgi:transposase